MDTKNKCVIGSHAYDLLICMAQHSTQSICDEKHLHFGNEDIHMSSKNHKEKWLQAHFSFVNHLSLIVSRILREVDDELDV